MTAPLTPERLAELRERYDDGIDDALEGLLELMATGHDGWLTKGRANWMESLKAYQADHVALLAEVERLQAERDRLAAQIAADADEDHVLEERAELSRAVGEERGRRAAAEHERDRLWMLLETERGLTGSIRLHAEALKLVTAFQIAANGESVERIHVDEMANNLLRVLGPQRPHAAPQAHAPGPWAGFADGEAAETPSGAQRPAEAVDLGGPLEDLPQTALRELKRTSGYGDPIDGRAPMSGLEAPPGVAPTDGRLYADGPPCRHDATWLVATDTGPQCMVCGPARPDPIAPQDEGISTADVMAQAVDDTRAYCPDCQLPETNCACG